MQNAVGVGEGKWLPWKKMKKRKGNKGENCIKRVKMPQIRILFGQNFFAGGGASHLGRPGKKWLHKRQALKGFKCCNKYDMKFREEYAARHLIGHDQYLVS